jgi:thioredoxin reductase
LDYNNAPEFNCSVNPEIGRESALRGLVAAPQKKKKVIVIGGGPAGLTAAIELRKRGHEVILFEKENKLGGKLWFAESVSFKKGVFLFMQYLIRSAEKWGMDFRLNREAAPKLVNDENPDAVIAAIGADAIKPDISGVDRKNVIFAEQAFKNSVFGNTVAVIGGDQIGSEVALYLAQQGKNVSILAPEAELAIDALKIPREGLLKRVEGIVNHETGVTGIEIGENQVVFRDSKRRVRTIAANSVVLSAGFQPRNELAELFRGTHAEFRVVGDSLRIGRLHNATRTAFDAANQI